MTQLYVGAKSAITAAVEGSNRQFDTDVLGSVPTIEQLERLFNGGYGFYANHGIGTTPVTFAGAYDADAPDLYVYVPSNKVVIPLEISVVFEAVGTESTMELIAIASNNGDSSATGTAVTPVNSRTDNPQSSSCTVTGSVDAAGITDPNAAGNLVSRFWQYQRPLTDTVATGENDRLPLVFEWRRKAAGVGPVVSGNTVNDCASISVYAASQAGTGFITMAYVEVPVGFFPSSI